MEREGRDGSKIRSRPKGDRCWMRAPLHDTAAESSRTFSGGLSSRTGDVDYHRSGQGDGGLRSILSPEPADWSNKNRGWKDRI